MNLQERTLSILKYSAKEIQNSEELQSEFYSVLQLNNLESNKRCLSCIPAKLEKLKAKQVSILNNRSMKQRRFYLPEGKVYRPFGGGKNLTNDNMTDEEVLKIIKKHPGAAKVFIDTEADGQEAPAGTGAAKSNAAPDEYLKKSGKELADIYKALTDQPAPKVKKEDLVVLIRKEEEAKAALEGAESLDEEE